MTYNLYFSGQLVEPYATRLEAEQVRLEMITHYAEMTDAERQDALDWEDTSLDTIAKEIEIRASTTPTLKLDEWRKTGRRVTAAEANEELGMPDFFESGSAVWIYEGGGFLEENPEMEGGHWLNIETSEWSGTREDLEQILYREWYLPNA